MGERETCFSKVIDSSEMACSLRFEDVRGCPYGIFTSEGIAILSIASSLLAVISLFAAA